MTVTNLTQKNYTTYFNPFLNGHILQIDCESVVLNLGDNYLSGVKATVEGNPCCFNPCLIDEVTITEGC